MALDLPYVCLTAPNLPAGWERAVTECYWTGLAMPTEYDKPGDPKSLEVSLCLAVSEPFSEPRIHRAMPGGIGDLEIYTQEVVKGIHDSWIDPAAGKWQYTYHERLTNYTVPGSAPVNQLALVVQSLAKTEHSRRAQAILWKPWDDPQSEHPACLQRLWFRLIGDRLVMSAHMRSNDAYKAAFMNMYAFTALQAEVAKDLSVLLDREIVPGQYNHIVDSFHIYGSYLQEVEGFLKSIEVRSFEDRTYTTEEVRPLIEEAREKLAAKENL